MERFYSFGLTIGAVLLGLLIPVLLPAQIQFPFSTPPVEEEENISEVIVPDEVPDEFIEPRISPRDSAPDRLARIFNKDLRDIEKRQHEILEALETLPVINLSFTQRAFGYHAYPNTKRPKEIVIDLRETVAPDAIALFPVTVQDNNGETISGYGFPKSFEIHFSNDANFADWDESRHFELGDGPRRYPFYVELGGVEGRYVRVRANELWRRDDYQAFALSEIMVFKGERNLSLGSRAKGRDTRQLGNKWSEKYVNDGITAFGIPHGNIKSPTTGYRSSTKNSVKTSWVQIDLEESLPIQEVRVILANLPGGIPDPQVRFPYSITVEVSEYEDMTRAETLGRFTPTQITQIGNNPLIIPVEDGYGRFVRLRVTQPRAAPMEYAFAELQVFSENQNVALGKSVRGYHPKNGDGFDETFLVDGFSSRYNLVSYQSWVSDLEQGIELDRELKVLEDQRHQLVDKTFTRGVATSLVGLIGVLALSLILVAQSRVRRRKDLEDLRQRIASDFHDDIGSNLSSIALLAELGKTEANEPDLVVEELTEIKLTADKTIESMKDIVWLIRPGEETWKQMMTRFRETASKLLRAHEYSFIEKGQMHDDRLPLEFKRDFFLIYKEVLNNIVRHAEASEVEIRVETNRGQLLLSVDDNGKGFDKLDEDFREGNGLRNLRMRSQAIGAKLKVKSKPTSGTIVTLTAPLP